MEVEQRIRKTFGQLEHIADRVTFPSTLSYRERAEMQKKHGCEYGRCASAPFSILAAKLIERVLCRCPPLFRLMQYVLHIFSCLCISHFLHNLSNV